MGGPKGRPCEPRTAGRSEAEDRKRGADLKRSDREERRLGGAGKSGPRDGFAGRAVVPGLRPRSRRWVRTASEGVMPATVESAWRCSSGGASRLPRAPNRAYSADTMTGGTTIAGRSEEHTSELQSLMRT